MLSYRAARIYVGIETRPELGVRHLSKLKRKKRNNNDKTSGRKRPRTNDIVPAPDSVLADLEETNLDIENFDNSVKFTSSTPNECLTPKNAQIRFETKNYKTNHI